ncbi:MAG: hypothetical protein HGB03_01610 [Candidatus Yonathbacteria bacterium]|nr:hypothetical protein [Candidatus Yonathbacteria bacterium]NTW47960.1 hypothetical protein [Candidatus Yonathbacteria bacterium]
MMMKKILFFLAMLAVLFAGPAEAFNKKVFVNGEPAVENSMLGTSQAVFENLKKGVAENPEGVVNAVADFLIAEEGCAEGVRDIIRTELPNIQWGELSEASGDHINMGFRKNGGFAKTGVLAVKGVIPVGILELKNVPMKDGTMMNVKATMPVACSNPDASKSPIPVELPVVPPVIAVEKTPAIGFGVGQASAGVFEHQEAFVHVPIGNDRNSLQGFDAGVQRYTSHELLRSFSTLTHQELRQREATRTVSVPVEKTGYKTVTKHVEKKVVKQVPYEVCEKVWVASKDKCGKDTGHWEYKKVTKYREEIVICTFPVQVQVPYTYTVNELQTETYMENYVYSWDEEVESRSIKSSEVYAPFVRYTHAFNLDRKKNVRLVPSAYAAFPGLVGDDLYVINGLENQKVNVALGQELSFYVSLTDKMALVPTCAVREFMTAQEGTPMALEPGLAVSVFPAKGLNITGNVSHQTIYGLSKTNAVDGSKDNRGGWLIGAGLMYNF